MKLQGISRFFGKAAWAVSVLFGAWLVTSSVPSVSAQYRDDRYYGYDIYRVAEQNGYRDGVDVGSKDGRDRKSYKPERSDRFEGADRGYDRHYGNKDSYKQVYRDAFRRGYDVGYSRYQGGYGRGSYPGPVYRRDRDRNSDYGYGRQGEGGFYDVARNQGYRDGSQQGIKDARNGRRPDPRRTDHYEDADNGYNRGYGDKEAYKQAYRDAYLRGYEDGFGQYGGGYRRSGGWFPFPLP